MVGDEITFVVFALLCRIEAAWAAASGGLDRSTVDNSRRAAIAATGFATAERVFASKILESEHESRLLKNAEERANTAGHTPLTL